MVLEAVPRSSDSMQTNLLHDLLGHARHDAQSVEIIFQLLWFAGAQQHAGHIGIRQHPSGERSVSIGLINGQEANKGNVKPRGHKYQARAIWA